MNLASQVKTCGLGKRTKIGVQDSIEKNDVENEETV